MSAGWPYLCILSFSALNPVVQLGVNFKGIFSFWWEKNIYTKDSVGWSISWLEDARWRIERTFVSLLWFLRTREADGITLRSGTLQNFSIIVVVLSVNWVFKSGPQIQRRHLKNWARPAFSTQESLCPKISSHVLVSVCKIWRTIFLKPVYLFRPRRPRNMFSLWSDDRRMATEWQTLDRTC
jgi:hypothetical protein